MSWVLDIFWFGITGLVLVVHIFAWVDCSEVPRGLIESLGLFMLVVRCFGPYTVSTLVDLVLFDLSWIVKVLNSFL